MDEITREKLLKIALITVGAIFFTIYRSDSFGRRDGSGMAAMDNIICR